MPPLLMLTEISIYYLFTVTFIYNTHYVDLINIVTDTRTISLSWSKRQYWKRVAHAISFTVSSSPVRAWKRFIS